MVEGSFESLVHLRLQSLHDVILELPRGGQTGPGGLQPPRIKKTKDKDFQEYGD